MTLYTEKYQFKNDRLLMKLLRQKGAENYVKKYLAKAR